MITRISQAACKVEGVLLKVDCEYGVFLGKVMSRMSSQYISCIHCLIAVLICFGYFEPRLIDFSWPRACSWKTCSETMLGLFGYSDKLVANSCIN